MTKNLKKKINAVSLLAIILIMSFSITGEAQNGLFETLSGEIDILVASDGSGDYTTVQAAINAVPNNSSEQTVMFIRNGTYYEEMYVSSSKKNLVMIGENVDSVLLTYDLNAHPEKGTGNTFTTPSFRVDADNFWALNITFENSYADRDAQALAVYSNADKQVFLHCRMLGYQDTFYSGSEERNYFKDCFIEGRTDYIFGETVIIFDSCQIQTVGSSGYITAASTKENYKFGYVFRNCNITGEPGSSGFVLGRPWKPYCQTVFMDSYLHANIISSGWREWNGSEETCFYAEYNNSGPGYVPESRVSWSHILTEEQAAEYTMENIFAKETGSYITNDWLPMVDQDPFYQAVKEHTLFFMDSSNYNANVSSIEYGGESSLEFDPDKYLYGIELPLGSTEVPELSILTEDPRAIVEIQYPESLPGVTEVRVLAYDRSTVAEYSIYNSIDGAFHNAYLDSITIKDIAVEGFQPEVMNYNAKVPEGSSSYFRVRYFKQVDDATAKYQRPATLPGELTVTVTSFSEEVVNVYRVNVSEATGVEKVSRDMDVRVYSNGHKITTEVYMADADAFSIEVFDVNGKLLINEYTYLEAGDNSLSLLSNLPLGIYFFEAKAGDNITNGKFAIGR